MVNEQGGERSKRRKPSGLVALAFPTRFKKRNFFDLITLSTGVISLLGLTPPTMFQKMEFFDFITLPTGVISLLGLTPPTMFQKIKFFDFITLPTGVISFQKMEFFDFIRVFHCVPFTQVPQMKSLSAGSGTQWET